MKRQEGIFIVILNSCLLSSCICNHFHCFSCNIYLSVSQYNISLQSTAYRYVNSCFFREFFCSLFHFFDLYFWLCWQSYHVVSSQSWYAVYNGICLLVSFAPTFCLQPPWSLATTWQVSEPASHWLQLSPFLPPSLIAQSFVLRFRVHNVSS